MMNTLLRRTGLALLLASGLATSACAPSRQYGTGVQAAKSDGFFQAMKRVARAHKLEVAEQNGGLNLCTADGDYLQFLVHGKELQLLVSGEETRLEKLHALGDQLVQEARATSTAKF